MSTLTCILSQRDFLVMVMGFAGKHYIDIMKMLAETNKTLTEICTSAHSDMMLWKHVCATTWPHVVSVCDTLPSNPLGWQHLFIENAKQIDWRYYSGVNSKELTRRLCYKSNKRVRGNYEFCAVLPNYICFGRSTGNSTLEFWDKTSVIRTNTRFIPSDRIIDMQVFNDYLLVAVESGKLYVYSQSDKSLPISMELPDILVQGDSFVMTCSGTKICIVFKTLVHICNTANKPDPRTWRFNIKLWFSELMLVISTSALMNDNLLLVSTTKEAHIFVWDISVVSTCKRLVDIQPTDRHVDVIDAMCLHGDFVIYAHHSGDSFWLTRQHTRDVTVAAVQEDVSAICTSSISSMIMQKNNLITTVPLASQIDMLIIWDPVVLTVLYKINIASTAPKLYRTVLATETSYVCDLHIDNDEQTMHLFTGDQWITWK